MRPELVLDTHELSVDEAVEKLIRYIERDLQREPGEASVQHDASI